METPAKKGMHPLIAIAAVSVTLFSLVGIAAITGLIPTSHSQPAQVETSQVQTATPPEAAAKLAETAQAAKAADVAAPPVSAPKPAARKVAAKRAKPVEHAAHPVEERRKNGQCRCAGQGRANPSATGLCASATASPRLWSAARICTSARSRAAAADMP